MEYTYTVTPSKTLFDLSLIAGDVVVYAITGVDEKRLITLGKQWVATRKTAARLAQLRQAQMAAPAMAAKLPPLEAWYFFPQPGHSRMP
jgi:hypothetical protein